MNMVERAGIVALGLLPLVLGCAGSDTDSLEMDGDEPVARPMGGNDTHNGLSGLDYQTHESALIAAMSQPLLSVTGGSAISNPVVLTALMPSEGGRDVFKYAMMCALPDGLAVSHFDGNATHSFPGEGTLGSSDQGTSTGTAVWLTGPLPTAARYDLIACLLTHVNPLGITVPLLISGAPVADDADTGGHAKFDTDEALWLVTPPGAAGAIVYNVFPLQALVLGCTGGDPAEALRKRVCGHDPENPTCGGKLHLRTDLATACTADPQTGDYWCDGVPVLKTTLQSGDLSDLHPDCAPPRTRY